MQLSQHVDWFKYLGLAFTIGLAGAAGLEGFIGFCLGCWMFGFAIRFGIVSPRVRAQPRGDLLAACCGPGCTCHRQAG